MNYAVAVAALCLPLAAYGEGSVYGVFCNGASGTAAVFDPTLQYGPGFPDGPVGEADFDLFGLNKAASVNFQYDTAPYSGFMGGRADISFGPDSPGINGQFSDIFLEGSAWSRTGGGAGGYTGNFTGSSIISMYFTVDEPTSWNWSADVSGWISGEAQASYQIYLMQMDDAGFPGGLRPGGPMLVCDEVNAAETGSFDAHVETGGVLEPGIYAIRISVDANAGLWNGPGFGEASATLTNGIFHLGGPVPAPTAAGLLVLAGLGAARRKRG